jgi:hypothetical protein
MIVMFLSVWLIPILIMGIYMYIDMEKGQSIEEYTKENSVNDPLFILVILLPIANCLAAICLIFTAIYNKIKHFRK